MLEDSVIKSTGDLPAFMYLMRGANFKQMHHVHALGACSEYQQKAGLIR